MNTVKQITQQLETIPESLETIYPSRLDELLKDIPYPSYQHMNPDIVNVFVEYLIGGKTNKTMNSMEACEIFRCFCVMNKRLCFMDKEFRKQYNIKEKIEKCKLMSKTEDIALSFSTCPIYESLPSNKRITDSQKKHFFSFITENYSSHVIENGDSLNYDIRSLITTYLDLVKYGPLDFDVNIANICVSEHISKYICSFLDLIKCFKSSDKFFIIFITELRTNYCKSRSYDKCGKIEEDIQYFIKTLLY